MAKRKIDNPPLLIRPEFRRMFANLSNEDVGILIHALMGYRWDGVLPELSDRLNGAFIALQAFADEDEEKYRQTCENNKKAIQMRWERERSGND